MGTGFIRFGGIGALLMIALGVIAIIVSAAAPGAMRNVGVSLIFGLLFTVLLICLYLATKSLWNRYGRYGGNVPLYFLVFASIVFLVLNATGGLRGTGTLQQVLGIVVIGVVVLYVIAWLWLSIYCIVAGNSAGGLWKAVGILYLVTTLLGTIALIVGAGAFVKLIAGEINSPGSLDRSMASTEGMLAGLMGVLGFIALIVGLAGLICHAIALMMGAGRLENQR